MTRGMTVLEVGMTLFVGAEEELLVWSTIAMGVICVVEQDWEKKEKKN